MNATFRIGDLAKQTGVKVVTIRYYEQSGLLPACERTARNYRVYGQDHLQRLHFVRRCRDLGFSVDQIKQFIQISAAELPTCADLCGIAVEHLREIESKIADLERLAQELRRIASTCNGAQPSAECRIIAALARMPGCLETSASVLLINQRDSYREAALPEVIIK